MTVTRLLQLTDLHIFADPAARLKGIPTRELLQDVLRHIQQSGTTVDHLIITGDHTHDELPATYQALRELLQPWSDRLWPVPGNHDDRTVLRSVFGDRIGGSGQQPIRFILTTPHWLCLGVDTHVPGEVSGQIGTEQVEWIEQQLQQHAQPHVALFMHHPPVTLHSVWMDRIGLLDQSLLHSCLQRQPRIELIVCGHVHHESAHRIGQAQIVTTPSTGIQFDPAGDVASFVAAPPGYRLIELSAQGFRTEVIRLPETRYQPVP